MIKQIKKWPEDDLRAMLKRVSCGDPLISSPIAKDDDPAVIADLIDEVVHSRSKLEYVRSFCQAWQNDLKFKG